MILQHVRKMVTCPRPVSRRKRHTKHIVGKRSSILLTKQPIPLSRVLPLAELSQSPLAPAPTSMLSLYHEKDAIVNLFHALPDERFCIYGWATNGAACFIHDSQVSSPEFKNSTDQPLISMESWHTLADFPVFRAQSQHPRSNSLSNFVDPGPRNYSVSVGEVVTTNGSCNMIFDNDPATIVSTVSSADIRSPI